jgi:hypothetical protein
MVFSSIGGIAKNDLQILILSRKNCRIFMIIKIYEMYEARENEGVTAHAYAFLDMKRTYVT